MTRRSVLVFAGLDPSGGAGIQADIEAIGALGAHALPIVTTLTVQDNDHVAAVYPVAPEILREQVQALLAKIPVAAIKIGIVGSAHNAIVIAETIDALRLKQPDLAVILDPVLASGRGDALTRENAVALLAPLRRKASLITPNLPEATALGNGATDMQIQLQNLLRDTPHVLIKGGHGEGGTVINRWFTGSKHRSWEWPRLSGSFHGSGCTLAAAIAALLAQGASMEQALDEAQIFTQAALARAYDIAEGQRIPARIEERT